MKRKRLTEDGTDVSHAKLKRLLAEAELDKAALKEHRLAAWIERQATIWPSDFVRAPRCAP